jgi:hypothetical protein
VVRAPPVPANLRAPTRHRRRPWGRTARRGGSEGPAGGLPIWFGSLDSRRCGLRGPLQVKHSSLSGFRLGTKKRRVALDRVARRERNDGDHYRIRRVFSRGAEGARYREVETLLRGAPEVYSPNLAELSFCEVGLPIYEVLGSRLCGVY